jgi:hypothetical protein
MVNRTSIDGHLTVGEILARTFRLLLTISRPTLIVSVGLIALVGIISAIQSVWLETQHSDDGIMSLASITFLFLVSLPVISFACVLLIVQVNATLQNEIFNIMESIRHTIPRILPFAVLSCFSVVVFFLILMAFALPAFILGTVVSAALNTGSAGQIDTFTSVPPLFVVGGVALMLFPLTYLFARWILAWPSVVIEGTGPITAIKRSWSLTRGQVWRMIGYTALLSIAPLIFSFLQATIIRQSLVLVFGENISVIANGIAQVASVLFNTLITPFYIILTVILYYDLLSEKGK